MQLEKNPKTRPIAMRLLQIEDKLEGKPFATMARVREISNYSCGPAALEMLFSFVGYKVSQRRIIKSIRVQNKIKLYGIDTKDMTNTVRIVGKKNLSFWRKEKASINDIYLVINKFKYPVGVEWQGDFYENEDEDVGHYGVITKIDKQSLPLRGKKSGNLRIADPYFNSFFEYKDLDRKYIISEFIKKWWDINEIKISGTSRRKIVKDTRMMFVITPKGETWPKRLDMVKK